MFNHEDYNKSLTDFREYDSDCTVNTSDKIFNAVILKHKFENDDVNIELLLTFNKPDDSLNRVFITYEKQCEHYKYMECCMYTASNNTIDSSLTQNCIPYFWNIGLKNYKLIRPTKIHSEKIKNDDFILIPDITLFVTYTKKTVLKLNESGLINYK